MRLIVSLFLLGLTSGCVVYGTGDETGIITPVGSASTTSEDDKT